jgi:hypothetical protein
MTANRENVWRRIELLSFIDGINRGSGRDVGKNDIATQNTAIGVRVGRVMRVIVYRDIAGVSSGGE